MNASPISLGSFLHRHAWQVTTILLVFLLTNVIVYSFSPPGSYLSPDTRGYTEPAKLLVEEGVYSSEFRLPGYPVLLASIMHFTDSIGAPAVAVQSVMLFTIALLTALFIEPIRPGSGVSVLALICFSPSALYYTQKVLPDVTFALLFVVYFYFLIRTYRNGGVYSAALVGVAAGLATIVRGNGQYLIYLIPVIFVLGYRLAHEHWPGIRPLALIAVSVVTAILTISPWLYLSAKEGNGFSVVSDSYRNYAIHDNVVTAVSLGKGLTNDQAVDAVYTSTMQREGITRNEWESLGLADKRSIVARNSLPLLAELSPQEFGFAVSKALLKFFSIGEGRGWSKLLQQDAVTLPDDAANYKFSLSAVLRLDPAVSITTLFAHALTITYYASIYLLCLSGLFQLVRVKAWDVLFSISICIGLFAGTAAFIGQARYRLPVEPLIISLASIGLLGVRHRLRSLRFERSPVSRTSG
jgi:hypothetical protein